MVNVKDKTCIYTGCKIIPRFNKEGETKVYIVIIIKKMIWLMLKIKLVFILGVK